MGGIVAVRLALAHAARLSHLVLVATSGGLDLSKPPAEKKPDKPDGGVPTSLTTGDEGNAVLPITEADMEKVVTRLGATTKPVSVDPKIGPEITGVDLNPRRTIILTDDPEQKKLPGDILKLVLTAPDPQDPDVQNKNFGPYGGIVPAVESVSGWPKP